MFVVKKHHEWLARQFFRFWEASFREVDEQETLQRLLRYSSSCIPYYRGRGQRLADYPLTNKSIVQGAPTLFTNPRYIKHAGYTSGTTGTPCKYYRDIGSMAAEQYFQGRYFGWKGKYLVVLRGERLFGANKTPARIFIEMPLIRELYISSYHQNDITLEPVVDRLQRIGHKVLWAYPSAACMLADYCLRMNAKLAFDVVVTSSEQLFEHQIDLLEKVFQCKVKDWYGQGERVAALYRCEYGHYHEVPGYSFVEYLEIGKGVYELVGTTLHNRAMPLVRFNTGDRVEVSAERCACGAAGRNIISIHGRQSDYLDLPASHVPGALFNVMFKKVRNIREAQIIQRPDKQVLLKIIRSDSYGAEDELILRKWVDEFLPKGMCHIVYVDEISKDRSGKYRFIINEGLAGYMRSAAKGG